MMETLGRSNYPDCDGVLWDKPVKESCPKCSAPFFFEKDDKKDGTIRYCQNEECDYKMAVDNPDATTDGTAAEAVSVETR